MNTIMIISDTDNLVYEIEIENIYEIAQQTFVMMKTSFVFVFRRRLQDVLIKTNIIVLVIRLQDVFKTFSRRLQDVFKTSSRRLQDVLQRSLQDVFKTYHQVKLFLLTRFQNDFEMYSKRF